MSAHQPHSTASPESEGKLVALGVALPSLASVFVALRFWVRRVKDTDFGIDDFFILFGLLLVWVMGITQILGASLGDLGRPIAVTPGGLPAYNEQSVQFLKYEYAFQVTEKLAFGAIKLSVLFFYRRIFVGRVFNILTWSAVVLVVTWSMSFFWATVFECRTDFGAIWSSDYERTVTSCTKTVHLLLGFAWSDVLTDFLILLIPIPMVARLQMPMRRKILVLGVFILGFLTVLAGVARLIFFLRAAADQYGADVPINTAPTIYWSLAEACVAIIAGCLPRLRPLFHGFAPESIIESLRERISLHSLRNSGASGGSNKACQHIKEPVDPSSARQPRRSAADEGSSERSEGDGKQQDGGKIYIGEHWGETRSEAIALGDSAKASLPAASDRDKPVGADRIKVTKAVTQTVDTV